MKPKHQKWNPKMKCNTFWKVFKTWRFSCVTPSTNLLQIQTTNSIIHLGNFYHHFKLWRHLFPIVFSHFWFMFSNNLNSWILCQVLLLLCTLLEMLLHVQPSHLHILFITTTSPTTNASSHTTIKHHLFKHCYHLKLLLQKILHTLSLHFHVSLFVEFMRKI
jgi:hypothetical protein